MGFFRALYDRMQGWFAFEVHIAFGNAQYFAVRRKRKPRPAQLPVARVVRG